MSTELQIVIVFGFFILLLMAAGFYIIWFPKCGELKLLYAVLNIVSLISLLVYVFFLYKQSSPIICGIIDSALKYIQNSNLLYLNVFSMFFVFILFAFSTSPMIVIHKIISYVLFNILGAIFFVFLSFIEKVYSLVHKFIHWLRNLFKLSKDK